MEVIKAPDLGILTKAHENKWVALSLDKQKLVAVAESLRLLREKLGDSIAIVMRVLPTDVGYAPTVRS
jgi:hypothetical protein